MSEKTVVAAAAPMWSEQLDQRVLAPTGKSGRSFKLWVACLVVVIAIGAYAFFTQVQDGLYVTGMRDRISWGLYIAAFVFFAGISMAGTLMSAILRATKATWRTPITRLAEAITVMALATAGLFVIVDMGQPVRLYQMYLNGNWQSPLMWDMMSITVYLTCSVVYLLVPMIPDLAMFRDRLLGKVSKFRALVYKTLSFGWEGNAAQHHALGKAVAILMVLIIPVAVSVHTVLSFVFSTTTRVSWNSTQFGFFFVFGAIFSGLAALILVFAVIRRKYHLQAYITDMHFKYLGYMLAAAGMVMIYANATEFINKGYHATDDDLFAFRELFVTEFAPLFWFYFFGGLVLPVLIV
ncbi:MAG: NrfD/PsrC family molybdoenzyme membrane anchor subunit, partial [Ilumatobacteraceae bacterium]